MKLFKRSPAPIDHTQFSDAEIDKMFKINGTQFDRRRKLTDAQIEKISKMYQKGKTIEFLAKKFQVKPQTIRYHVDKDFRAMKIASVTYHPDSIDYATRTAERVAYKRELIASGKLQ